MERMTPISPRVFQFLTYQKLGLCNASTPGTRTVFGPGVFVQ